MKLKELIERVKIVALETGGSKPDDSEMLDPEVLAEVILPRVFQLVVEEAMSTPLGINATRRDHSITLVAGKKALGTGLVEKYAEAFYVKTTTAAASFFASLEPQYHGYVADSTLKMPKFYVEDNTIHYREAGGTISTSTATIIVNGPTIPQVPVDYNTTDIDLEDYLLQKVIVLVAGLVNGEVRLSELSMDPQSLKFTRPKR